MAARINETWLKSCLDQVILPGSPWYKVKDMISKYLVDRIRIQGLDQSQVEKLGYFLGTKFLTDHSVFGLKENVTVPKIVRPTTEDKEIENLCKALVVKAAMDAKCDYDGDLGQTPESFQNLVTLITSIIETTLRNQIEAVKQSKFVSNEKNSLVSEVMALTDRETELLGDALITILQKEPSRLEKILETLNGRLFPTSFRSVAYRMILVKMFKERFVENEVKGIKKHKPQLSQQVLREIFAENIKIGMKKTGITNATSSPIKKLIQTTVVQVYDTNGGLKSHATNFDAQKECSKVLNVLYTTSNKFEPFYVVWLLPIQLTIRKDVYAPEHLYDLTMWLDCFIKYGFPVTIDDVNEIVVNIWDSILNLSEMNSLIKLFLHHGIPCTMTSIHKLVFLRNRNDIEQKPLSSSVETPIASSVSNISLESNFTINTATEHPVLCIRKWVLNLFVGITNVPVSMFLFDQLFMTGFAPETVEKCSIVIMQLLEPFFTNCQNPEQVCLVMLEQVCELKLVHVHKLWNKASLR